jgi:outer membrane protein assembly factor BamB
MTTPAYPVVFASPGRDSAVPFATVAKGRVTWSRDIGQDSTSASPPQVLLWRDNPIVVTSSHVQWFDREGELLGRRERQPGSPVVLHDGRIYFKGRNGFLQAVDEGNHVILADAPFPGAMGAEVRVQLLWPRNEDFLAVTFWPGDRERADGDPADTPLEGPEITVLRNRYESTYGDFTWTEEGRPRLPPLLRPDRGEVTVALDRFVRIDAERGREIARFGPIDAGEWVEWSLNSQGRYGLVGYTGVRKLLILIDDQGREVWRWTDDAPDRWARTQPPIQQSDGRVVVLTEGRVIVVDAGRTVWQFDVLSDRLRHGAAVDDGSFEVRGGRLLAVGGLRHGTSLADGSLLATIGGTLYHFSKDGRKLFSVAYGEEILSAPVVDAEGIVYFATGSKLVQIR